MKIDPDFAELLRICCGPLNLSLPCGIVRFPVYRRNVVGIDGASCSLGLYSSRVTSAFVIDLYVGLPLIEPFWRRDCSGRVGTSPVKLTNHFPEVNPPDTMTLDRRLTVSAADRRSLEVRIAMLHQFAGAGTSPRPKRESSPGTVSWLFRYHC